MASACTCRYCTTPQTTAHVETPAPAPIPELPAEPRRFLVHTALGPQDCTLHPDGRITMQASGQTYRSAFSLEEMFSTDEPAGSNWSRCPIDWDVTDEDVARATQATPETGQASLFPTPATSP